MHQKLNPSTILAPVSNYANGTLSGAGLSWVHASGQVGITKEGKIPSDFEAQCVLAMDNVLEVLKAGGMGPEDIVKMNFYLTDRADLAAVRQIRDAKLNNVPVASTLLFVSGFVMTELKIEIDAVAAKAL